MKKIISSATIALTLALPFMVSAHEHQAFEIGGATYEFTVGSLNEPIAVDDKTGVDLRVERNGAPLAGLETALKVELIAGDKKKTLDLSPVYNTPGAYKAAFFPTVQTTYAYRVFGELEKTPVDLTFTCTPAGHARAEEDTARVEVSNGVTRVLKSGGFGCPTAKAELGFPEASADVVSITASDSTTRTIAVGSGMIAVLSLVVAAASLRRRA